MSRDTNRLSVRDLLVLRLPEFQSIAAVFAVTSVVLYGWTILEFGWKLSSWLYNLTVWEIFSVFSYLMVFNFLEAVLALLGLIILSLLLPVKIMRDAFVARGGIIVLCILGSMLLHLKIVSNYDLAETSFVQSLWLWWLVTFIVTFILTWFIPKMPLAVKALKEFADRAIVFLFILLPLSAIGLIVIVVRFFSAD
jgi:hypothetical protein